MADGTHDDSESLSNIVARLSRLSNRKLHVGTALMPHLLDDPVYEAIANKHFDLIVCEHHQKWEPLLAKDSQGDEVYDFSRADHIIKWALTNKKVVKGHTLVWHVTSPKWIENLPPHKLKEALYEHIKITMNHYFGQVESWDVVNEPFHPDTTGRLAENVFFCKLGPNYIEDCFRYAHHQDCNAKLILNENKVEGCGLPNSRSNKSDAFYEAVKDMASRGVPVHEVGLQAHFDASGTGARRIPTPLSVCQNIRRLGELGLTVNISEMDIRTAGLEEFSVEQKDSVAAQIYHDMIYAALQEDAFRGVTFWGFTDGHSWIHDYYSRPDRPLLWDARYAKKAAFYGVCNALLERIRVIESNECSAIKEEYCADVQWGEHWMRPEPDDASGRPIIGVGIDEPDWNAGHKYSSSKFQ